ncbi:DUF2877 domain-containing protein [Thermomonospora umbrina]|uniref:Uncharacterized protein DUF2877 n=1 Tax=Thermomonospora umbrina TaxID=111806 RepID=A0A3D9SYL7_9ACTN|nr:DUF2877 domain-containing protein [Thermomonospora umbrina]REE99620.1 uncharacterized protein DUF2877 [Thermomonospora umbrina]
MTAVMREPVALPIRQRPRPPLSGAARSAVSVRGSVPDSAPALGPVIPGAAGVGLRDLIDPPRSPARVIAAFPSALYLEMRAAAGPRVLAVVTSDAVRLPNAVVIAAGSRERPLRAIREGDEAWVGEGHVEVGALRIRVRRWWDPSPALGDLTLARLADGVAELEAACAGSRFGLPGHPDPQLLAARCAAGDLAGSVEAAERIVGLGPGLTPTGDDVLAGLLVALRTVGAAVADGRTALWLADWLGAAVTADAETRTTTLAATLLHCADAGQAGAEAAAVLRGVAGHDPVGPAARRLLAAGHTSGADIAFGLLAGCRAVLSLSHAALAERGAPL